MCYDFVETETILRSFQERYFIHIMNDETETEKISECPQFYNQEIEIKLEL